MLLYMMRLLEAVRCGSHLAAVLAGALLEMSSCREAESHMKYIRNHMSTTLNRIHKSNTLIMLYHIISY